MGRRKITKENIRNIQRTRRTYYITIPLEIMKSFGWKERQKVIVKKLGRNKIIISDWK
jgi:bifunctional DNA-binding transcriptional regulator/antitoxin component of YhaV-PrlF toxin-antitoxin module